MNQGNSGQFVGDDGVYQDGGVLVHFPDQQRMGRGLPEVPIAVVAHRRSGPATRSTAPVPAHRPPPPEPPALPTHDEPDGLVRIVAALVNSDASRPKQEVVTLHQHRPARRVAGGMGAARHAEGAAAVEGHAPRRRDDARCRCRAPLALSNKGGVITVVDDKGLKVHGVAYTKEQARQPGWTLVF